MHQKSFESATPIQKKFFSFSPSISIRSLEKYFYSSVNIEFQFKKKRPRIKITFRNAFCDIQ